MLKGVLEGIANILTEGLKSDNIDVLKAHMTSAKSMLTGVLKECSIDTGLPGKPRDGLDPVAQAAADDLR